MYRACLNVFYAEYRLYSLLIANICFFYEMRKICTFFSAFFTCRLLSGAKREYLPMSRQ